MTPIAVLALFVESKSDVNIEIIDDVTHRVGVLLIVEKMSDEGSTGKEARVVPDYSCS